MTISLELTIGVVFTFIVQFIAMLKWVFTLSNKNDNNEKEIILIKTHQEKLLTQNQLITNSLNELTKTLAICQAVNKNHEGK